MCYIACLNIIVHVSVKASVYQIIIDNYFRTIWERTMASFCTMYSSYKSGQNGRYCADIWQYIFQAWRVLQFDLDFTTVCFTCPMENELPLVQVWWWTSNNPLAKCNMQRIILISAQKIQILLATQRRTIILEKFRNVLENKRNSSKSLNHSQNHYN